MLSRGYDGEARALDEPALSPREIATAMAGVGVLLLIAAQAYAAG